MHIPRSDATERLDDVAGARDWMLPEHHRVEVRRIENVFVEGEGRVGDEVVGGEEPVVAGGGVGAEGMSHDRDSGPILSTSVS